MKKKKKKTAQLDDYRPGFRTCLCSLISLQFIEQSLKALVKQCSHIHLWRISPVPRVWSNTGLVTQVHTRMGNTTKVMKRLCKHGLGEMNDNGERFAELFGTNIILLGGSIFPYKSTHKASWISGPSHREPNRLHLYHQDVPVIIYWCSYEKKIIFIIRLPASGSKS